MQSEVFEVMLRRSALVRHLPEYRHGARPTTADEGFGIANVRELRCGTASALSQRWSRNDDWKFCGQT